MKWCLKMSHKLLKEIYFKAVDSVKSQNIISNNVSINKDILTISSKKYDLKEYSNLYIYGVGKAALDMAKECERILGERITNGLIISHQKGKLKYLKTFQSTHPLVSKKSLKAAKALIDEFKNHTKKDLVVFLLSGGASAMIELPIDGLSLEDFRKISKALLISGIDIKAFNSVRKSISLIKGGKLSLFSKAVKEVLVLSDVIGNDINTIGSAPMNDGNTPHTIIGSNEIALKQAKKRAKKDFKKVKIVTTKLDKNSQDAANYIIEVFNEYNEKYSSFCLLFGGETTTIAKENGVGGRNQELALRILKNTKIDKNINILCAGSDGIDGNSDSTGAFLDSLIYEKIEKEKLDINKYLEESNSNLFFKKLGYDLTIGPTGTNVMDFIIITKEV